MLPFLLALAFQCPDGTPPPCRGARAAAATITVAVLPFDNLSRDTNDSYLASGLTEEITGRLSMVERLTVTSSAVMRHYRGDEDPRRVATNLRVAHLVAGTIRHERQRLRISVELIRARDGVVAWNRAFDQPDSTLLDIQEAIARSVATSITGRLLPEERAALQVPRHPSAAHDHFLRGTYAFGSRTTSSLRRAVQEFELAIQIDSAYGDALAMLANTWYLLGSGYYDSSLGEPREALMERGRALARRALERDSMSSRAWGIASTVVADTARQRYLLERALVLDPNNAEALVGMANLSQRAGDMAARERYLRRAVAVDPTQSISLLILGMHLAFQGRYAEGRAWLDSAIVFHPEAPYFYSDRAHVRLAQGDTSGVRDDAEMTRRLGNDTAATALLVALAARSGDSTALRAGAAWLRAHSPADCRFNFNCVEVALGLVAAGDVDGALAMLEKAWTAQNALLLDWQTMPGFDPIRGDPRFRRLVAPNR